MPQARKNLSELLLQTKKLADNTYERIFSTNPPKDGKAATYKCHLCNSNPLTERELFDHIDTSMHCNRVKPTHLPNAEPYREGMPEYARANMIYPKGPQPFGLVHETVPKPRIEVILENYNLPFVGFEYVIELKDNYSKDSTYFCVLCEKDCVEDNIVQHLSSQGHRIKFLELNYPIVMGTLKTISVFNVDLSYREEVLTQIATQIVEKFGRQKPIVYYRNEFEVNKDYIIEKIRRKGIYTEEDFPSSKRKLLKFMRKYFVFSDLSSSTPPPEESDDDEEESLPPRRRRPYSNPKKKQKLITVTYELVERDYFTPKEISKLTRKRMERQRIIERYILLIESKVKRLQARYDGYRKNPETHPLYDDEYKAFHNRRYKEVAAQGKDPEKYNYKPEWVVFWTKRLEELYRFDLDLKKNAVRRKLYLNPEEAFQIENDIDNVKRIYVQREKLKRQKKAKKYQDLDISDDSDEDYRSNPKPSNDLTLKSLFKSDKPENVPAERNSILTVCRQLSNMGRELDNLIPKINKLYLEALEKEKIKRHSGDDLLFDQDNMKLLIDARDRLRDQIDKYWVTASKRVAMNKAMQDVIMLQTVIFCRMEIFDENLMKEEDERFYNAKVHMAKTLASSAAIQKRENSSNEEFDEILASVLQQYVKEFKKPDIDIDAFDFSKFEKLDDEDLIVLMRNFTDLSKEESDQITAYLLKIEKTNPKKAYYIRRFENLGDEEVDFNEDDEIEED